MIKIPSLSCLCISVSSTSTKYVATGSTIPRLPQLDSYLQKQTLRLHRCARQLSIC